MGRTPMVEWAIDPGHFAERFQLFVIIVLGESIVITGGTASDAGLDGPVVAALVCAFGSTVALWWLYFGRIATASARAEAVDDTPGQTGRDAYTYLHLPIVAGVLLSAVGDELVLAHPTDELGTAGALVTLGGPALYLVGLAAFGRRIGRRPSAAGLVAAALLLAAVPLAARADGLVVVVAVTAVLVVLAAAEGGLRRGHGHPGGRRVPGT
jgi:low temperature requirement protein LtrA